MEDKFHVNVYDFDKTIYSGDSTLDFYLFCISQKPIILVYLPISILYFIIYKLGFIEKIKFKEKFFSFLKSMKKVDCIIQKFWENNIKKIQQWFLDDKSNNKIIISASPEFLLNPIKDEIGVLDIIASKVEKNSGKFISPNCYGEEKVRRFKEKYSKYIIQNFYSDSLSDIHLAKISEKSYLVKKNSIIQWNV